MAKRNETIPDIRISDPYVKRLVKSEQASSGEGTATKTAARLIIERLTLKQNDPKRTGATSLA